MIPTWPAAIASFFAASAFFTVIGLPLARAVAPRAMPPLAMAPALGWAVSIGLAFPLLSLTGFGVWPLTFAAIAAVAAALVALRRGPPGPPSGLPRWSLALACALAILPATAIMPKATGQGILVAPPLFDHVKIALIDTILRTGLPVPNPFVGDGVPGGLGHLAYYYLWHFGAAALAGLMHTGGWSADAAMTGFTAFSSVVLVMGAAIALGAGRRGMCLCAILLLPASLRPLLEALTGAATADRLIPRQADFGGWLNQAAWVPQHLASACCLILVCLLMLSLAERGRLLVAVVLGITAAAAFESSVWVGGIALAAVGLCLCAMLVFEAPPRARASFLLYLAAAAAVAAMLAWPFIQDDLRSVASRHSGAGMAFRPYAALGAAFPAGLRPILDVPAFWFLLLPFALPAIVPGAVAGLSTKRRMHEDPDRRRLAQILWVAAGACLGVAWLFASTIANNDLGWRAVLPAILLLSALAATGLMRLAAERRWIGLAAVLALASLGVPDAARLMRGYAGGQLPGDAPAFSRAVAVWQAMRRHTGPGDRVANNVQAVALATPWPVNIGWATLADRPSCFAGWASVLAYGALPMPRLIEANDLFERVFAGHPRAGDVVAMAHDYDCAAVAVSRSDGAWVQDPFAEGGIYGLAEQGEDWRIYKRK